MNDDRLVACLAKYADSQETIQAVRKAIVGLAVAGRLDDRSPSQFADPLGEFIGGLGHHSHTIGAKAKTLESKFETTDLPHPSLTPDRFVRLGDIAKIEKGKTGIKQASSGPYPLVVTASDRGSCDHYDFDGAAAIVPLVSSTGHGKASLHRLHYQEGKFALGSILAAVLPKSPERISARFLFEYLSAYKEELLVARMIGTANVSLSVKKISEVPVPIVSRMAQRTVDELMALCDRLEAEHEKREATRDRLTSASLTRLTAPDVDPTQFKAHADFAIRVLPELTTRPDQIKVLRQTILDLAVRGKLVEQDSNDEPASELIAQLAANKARLVKAGEKKRDTPRTRLATEECPFELPGGWVWTRLGNLIKFVTSGSRDWAKHYSTEGAIFVRMGNLSRRHYRLRLDQVQRVKPPADGEGTRTRLEAGDILISITGDVGMLGLIPEGFGEAYINQHTAMVRPMPQLTSRYLPELFRSSVAQAQFNEPQRGIKNSFRLTDVVQLIVPVPPLAEQHRIVAKIDELMMLCDHLEQHMVSVEEIKDCVLEVLVVEALARGPALSGTA